MQSESSSLPPSDWPDSSHIAEDDIQDSEAESQQYPLLAPLLEDCAELCEHHKAWDVLAKKQFQWHSFLLICTAVLATLAVLLAILQLPDSRSHGTPNDSKQTEKVVNGHEEGKEDSNQHSNHSKLLEYAEVSCAAFAFVAVLIGLKVTFDHRWRQHRFQAEHARFVKFGYLLNAAKWNDDRKAGRKFLKTELDLLTQLDSHAPEQWVLRHRNDINPPPLESTEIDEKVLAELVDYFRRKRISYQASYFRSEAEKRKSRERWSAAIPLYLFFLSLLAAIGHFAVGHFSTSPLAKDLAFWLLVAAATLPVIAAGVRTVRGAMEYGRNANRYASLYAQLWEIEKNLREKVASGDVAGQMYALRDVELALESEHRSWQRLMIETEWFG